MKKAIKIFLRITGILVLVLLLAAIIVPSLFKEQIKDKVVAVANEKVNAELAIGDFGITLFRNFPNLTFRLKQVSITGVDSFEGDTLAALGSFNLVFDISSVLSKSGYRIKAIEINRPVANAIILKDGSTNYDIMPEKDTEVVEAVDEKEEDMEQATGSTEKDIAFNLNKFEIRNGMISYTDDQSGMKASINGLNLALSGNMAEKKTGLTLKTDINALDFEMDGIKMVKRAELHAGINVNADLENNIFVLDENSIAINDLQLIFSGSVEMQEEDIIADLKLATGNTEFKSVLSMIPAVYMQDFEGLKAGGSFGIEGAINGRYSASDSLLPDVSLSLNINDGSISYPDLPGSIDDINVITNIAVNGRDLDRTVADIKKFHFELENNPFDMKLRLETPVSDPEVKASFNGTIDFAALSNALPVDMEQLEGIMSIALNIGAKMSMIENKDFENVTAQGSLSLNDVNIMMEGLPPLTIEKGGFGFTPQYASLDELIIGVAGNKIQFSGRLENYLPFVLKGETISGKLDLYSEYLNLDTIFSYMPADTSEIQQEDKDTVALAVIKLPENIDFEFGALIDRFIFSPLEAEKVKGNIYLKNGVLRIEDTGLKSLGGEVVANAEYDSCDSIPFLSAGLSASGIGIRESFNTFNTVRKLAPVAEGIDGDISVIFDFSAQLGEGMMPVTESINGTGRMTSDEIQLVSSPVYEKMASILQIGDEYTNTFKDINVSFEIRDGRVYIKPFNTKLGDMKLIISGDHGLDQTINYLAKVEVPSAKLPGSMKAVLSGLAAKAVLLGIKYEQPETIRMNVKIGGTVKDPQIAPSLAQGEGAANVKETVKEAVGEVVEQKVEEVKEQVSEEARKQADKILAEAQKKADLVKSEAAEVAGKIRNEAGINAQKLIDEAADKGVIAKMAASKAAETLKKEADKKATQLEEKAGEEADKIIEEARAKATELIEKKL